MNFGIGTPKDLTLTNEKLPKWDGCKNDGVCLDKKPLFHDHFEYVVEKLYNFSGLFYKVRELLLKQRFLLFYSFFAKSILSYGILTYNSAVKNNLKKIDRGQRKILLKKKYDSVGYLFESNKNLTVIKLHEMERFSDFFRQLRMEACLVLLTGDDNCS